MNYNLVRRDVLLKSMNTYHIGGSAKYFCTPENVDALLDALAWAKQGGIPWFCLGMGSNVLIDDKGVPGLVIRLGKGFKNINLFESRGIASTGGGCSLRRVGTTLIRQGWSGFEYMCVIPGTVGAAVRINAGTKEGEIKDKFASAQVIMPNLETVDVSAKDLNFSNRYSRLTESQSIVVSASFQIDTREPPEMLTKRVGEIESRRKAIQPKNPRNCGSVFKNPMGGAPAGWYIEQAGLKGMRIGDAQIAGEHGNWIVNLGNATAKDVKGLIEYVKEKVFQRFGIELRREVIYVPEDLV